jgi:hypothetical protein
MPTLPELLTTKALTVPVDTCKIPTGVDVPIPNLKLVLSQKNFELF